MLAVAFGTQTVGSSPTLGIFLYVAQTVERVLEVAFRNIYVGFSPTLGKFLYAVQAVENFIAVAFKKKLIWFESHSRHISLYCLGS